MLAIVIIFLLAGSLWTFSSLLDKMYVSEIRREAKRIISGKQKASTRRICKVIDILSKKKKIPAMDQFLIIRLHDIIKVRLCQ